MKVSTNLKAGPTAVEYAVMLALIIVVCLTGAQTGGLGNVQHTAN